MKFVKLVLTQELNRGILQKNKVTILDYGVGNLLSVARAVERIGASVEITSDPGVVSTSSRLIIPGVGAFGTAMRSLESLNLVGAIQKFAATGRPVFGICLGMQLLMTSSDEFGTHAGLNLIDGTVARIPSVNSEGEKLKLPHIGWSQLFVKADGLGTVLENFPDQGEVYFTHSFMASPSQISNVIGTAEYQGIDIVAAVSRDNISGCQFHPEKSGPAGLSILENFLRI